MMTDSHDDGLRPDSEAKILQILENSGCEYRTRSFDSKAHHASDAAALLGCPLGAVVKSLVFQNVENGRIALVLVSGENRVDINQLSQILGFKIQPAKPGDIQTLTGYPVGAVPPIGVQTNYPVIIDADLMSHKAVWASAGSVHTLVQVKSNDLRTLTQGRVEKIQ